MKDSEFDYSYLAQPSECGYLPEETSQLHYAVIEDLTPEYFSNMINKGWRRFGHILFRPMCPACTKCQPIRVLASRYKPNRSQRRVIKANQGEVELRVVTPELTKEKMLLYMAHHSDHALRKGWPEPSMKGGLEHLSTIIAGSFPVEEWCYFVNNRLVAVAYMDRLTDGYSGIYYFYDPSERTRQLGTWILITMIQKSVEAGLPYAHLGYFVKGCSSMEYKGLFKPAEILHVDGVWRAAEIME